MQKKPDCTLQVSRNPDRDRLCLLFLFRRAQPNAEFKHSEYAAVANSNSKLTLRFSENAEVESPPCFQFSGVFCFYSMSRKNGIRGLRFELQAAIRIIQAPAAPCQHVRAQQTGDRLISHGI